MSLFKAKKTPSRSVQGMKKPKKYQRRRLVRTTLKEDTGKYLLDINKLVLAGIVISEVLQRGIDHDILLFSGLAVVFATFILGTIMVRRKIKREKTVFRRQKRSKR